MNITDKFNQVIAKAENIYGIDLSDVILEPSIKGYRAIGEAGTYAGGVRKFRYSPVFLENNPEYYINQIVPHEVAHIVCNELPHLGKNHDMGWRRVAACLGCDKPRATVPAEVFTVEMKKRKKAKTYSYVDSKGGKHELTGQRHALIKKGKSYTVNDTGADLDISHYIGE